METLFEKVAKEEGKGIEEFTKEVYYNYHKKLPVIKDSMTWCHEVAKAQGYIDTMGGRRLHKPEPQYDPTTCKINDFIYKMLNKLIQGTAADILKQALITAYDAGIYDVLTLHLLVHDEQVNSVPFNKEGAEAAVELQHIMGSVYRDELLVPIKAECELGPNWGYWSSRIYEDMKKGVFNPAEFNADYKETH
jgi:DNA polymerase-1